MQLEIMELLREGKKLCALDVVDRLKAHRSEVSKTLAQLERTREEVTANYVQENINGRVFTVKYYKIKL